MPFFYQEEFKLGKYNFCVNQGQAQMMRWPSPVVHLVFPWHLPNHQTIIPTPDPYLTLSISSFKLKKV